MRFQMSILTKVYNVQISIKMKKLFKKLKNIEKEIEAKQNEIFNIVDSKYYVLMKAWSEQERDLRQARTEMRVLYSRKQAILENLSIAINLEQSSISNKLRQLTLTNYSNEKHL